MPLREEIDLRSSHLPPESEKSTSPKYITVTVVKPTCSIRTSRADGSSVEMETKSKKEKPEADEGSSLQIPKANLFPNPAKGFAQLELEGLVGRVDIVLFDLSGRIMERTHIDIIGNKTSIPFDLSDFPKGIYFIYISHPSYQESLRFMKAE